MMPILVKSDDVRSGRKAKARYGRHRSQLKIVSVEDSKTAKVSRLSFLAKRQLVYLA